MTSNGHLISTNVSNIGQLRNSRPLYFHRGSWRAAECQGIEDEETLVSFSTLASAEQLISSGPSWLAHVDYMCLFIPTIRLL